MFQAAVDEIQRGGLPLAAIGQEGFDLDAVRSVLRRFHTLVAQLRRRHQKRPTLDVTDEYDVQDLLHGLLRLLCPDVRPEEHTPSYAGRSARVDFFLPIEETVIEVKKTRAGLADRELGDEFLIDVGRYQSHPGCKRLICFVYDPDERLTNPAGIVRDLTTAGGGTLEVEVIVAPQR